MPSTRGRAAQMLVSEVQGPDLKCAVVALTSTGNVVAAVTGKKIRVYALEIQSSDAGMVTQLRDGTAGAFLTIPWELDAGIGLLREVNPPYFLFETTAGNALRAVLSGVGTVNISVYYWDEDAV